MSNTFSVKHEFMIIGFDFSWTEFNFNRKYTGFSKGPLLLRLVQMYIQYLISKLQLWKKKDKDFVTFVCLASKNFRSRFVDRRWKSSQSHCSSVSRLITRVIGTNKAFERKLPSDRGEGKRWAKLEIPNNETINK